MKPRQKRIATVAIVELNGAYGADCYAPNGDPICTIEPAHDTYGGLLTRVARELAVDPRTRIQRSLGEVP